MTSILIVHPDKKTQRIVQRVLGVTGHRIDVADDIDQGLRAIAAHGPALVVVDGAVALAPRAGELFSAATARGACACMTLVAGATAGDGPRLVPSILGTGAVTNLLVQPMPVLAEELTITAHKLLSNDVFGAEKYLLWGTALEQITLTRASERADVVARLAEVVRARGQSAKVASMAQLVADELISNAVHNAPCDAAGVHYRREVSRTHELPLDGRHAVQVRWGCDARYLAIEVTDQFGSLDRDTILGALAKQEVRSAGSGAGMGIALAYRSCDHLVFNLAPGRRTEIIALIDVRFAPTERAPASSYNVFVERT